MGKRRCRLKAYVSIQGDGGSKITKSDRSCFMNDPQAILIQNY